MTQPLDTLTETPSQTAGPYVHIGCIPSFAGVTGVYPEDLGLRAIQTGAKGEEITITGSVIKPGAVPMPDGTMQAPHIALWIVARGINIGLQTRLYFGDEDNSTDPLLARIEQRPRADTLIAKRVGEGQYRFDIRLQGDVETVFLDI